MEMPKTMTKIDKATAVKFAEFPIAFLATLRAQRKGERVEVTRRDGGKIIALRFGAIVRFWTYGY